ncbi:MAG: hypothetical protein F6J98_29635 [Moorea sp. SIO4G2]|nr:hypothetical protein [Moorena sp. SIO4G2]
MRYGQPNAIGLWPQLPRLCDRVAWPMASASALMRSRSVAYGQSRFHWDVGFCSGNSNATVKVGFSYDNLSLDVCR